MSTVAYDGKMIAADKQGTKAGLKCTTTKIQRLENGVVLAWTGDESAARMLLGWYINSGDPKEWPDFQNDDDSYAHLIVANKDGCTVYEQRCVAVQVEDKFMAWGSGRDFAIAAMHLGKTAREAVELASIYDAWTGRGVNWFTLDPVKVSDGDTVEIMAEWRDMLERQQ